VSPKINLLILLNILTYLIDDHDQSDRGGRSDSGSDQDTDNDPQIYPCSLGLHGDDLNSPYGALFS
jgi:hypothetical protein